MCSQQIEMLVLVSCRLSWPFSFFCIGFHEIYHSRNTSLTRTLFAQPNSPTALLQLNCSSHTEPYGNANISPDCVYMCLSLCVYVCVCAGRSVYQTNTNMCAAHLCPISTRTRRIVDPKMLKVKRAKEKEKRKEREREKEKMKNYGKINKIFVI